MKTLSFIIPVYNEEQRIKTTLTALSRGFSFDGLDLKHIYFVDDGSIDNTVKIIKNHKKTLGKKLGASIDILSYPENKGKGYAVRQGMLTADTDYALFFDADMSTPLTEFKKFLPYIQKNADVVIGTRKNGQSTVVKHQPKYRELLGRGFTLLSQLVLNTWVTDFTCGFKLFSRQATDEIFKSAKINRWSYDSELLFLANRLGYTLHEAPVLWSNDARTKVNLIKDLPKTLIDLFYIRLSNLNLKSVTVKRPAFSSNH